MLINLVKTVNHWVKSSYTRDWFSPLVSLNGTHKFVHSNSLEVKTDPSFVTTFNSVVHSFHAILSTPVRKRNIVPLCFPQSFYLWSLKIFPPFLWIWCLWTKYDLKYKKYLRKDDVIMHDDVLAWRSFLSWFDYCAALEVQLVAPQELQLVIESLIMRKQIMKQAAF